MADPKVIDDRYEVIERIGSGGMADVFLATDRQLDRKVAIKLLHMRYAEDPEFVERFRREASAAAGLQHPHVVAVYDRGQVDDTYYIAMEYLEGRSLKELVIDDAPLDPDRAIDLITQVLQAARFAHKRGIIHRDLKPHNVIVDDEDVAKVTDFGIARAGASDMTQTGSIMGTAQYLSPEQAQGHDVSAASDLYSVGIMLYELLTGQIPFEADSAVAIALKQVSEDPVPPSQLNSAVSPELEAVVMRALEKDPIHRFASAEEMIAALAGAKHGIAPDTTSAHIGAPFYVADDDGLNLPDWWPFAAAAGVLAILLLLLVLLLSGGENTKEVPRVIGAPQAEAEVVLKEAGFKPSIVQTSSERPRDTVIGQDPLPGTEAEEGASIQLTVSSGPGSNRVPDVTGLTKSAARAALVKAGFRASFEGLYNDSVSKNRVIETRPEVGSELDKGFRVRVVVSKGKEPVEVPSVTGLDVDEARSELDAADFRTTVTELESEQPAGTVITQTPLGETKAPKDSIVKLTVAKEPESATVPDVIGRTQANALNAISAAGFRGRLVVGPADTEADDGKVIAQTPSGGRTVKKGQTVTVTIGRFIESADAHHADNSSPGHAVKVAVLSGGRSSEHDVSVKSGQSVAAGLREAGHEVKEVTLKRDGTWTHEGAELDLRPGRGLLECDVAFPVLHGPFGEDGTVQGLLELLDIAYAGSGVLASAACLDKVVFKELMAQRGLAQVGYALVQEGDDPPDVGYPCWVKPARLGSSVGIVRVANAAEMPAALKAAFGHDPRVIVEAHCSGVEVEASVLGHTDSPEVSEPGEIELLKGAGWYDFEAKYAADGMRLQIPARISQTATERVKALAAESFTAAGCSGMARVDFFVEGDHVLLNEINTLPGFTSTSVYGALWDASGLKYPGLVDRICQIAVERHQAEQGFRLTVKDQL